MTDHGQTYDYPAVGRACRSRTTASRTMCAPPTFLNAGRFDVVCLQHEFGIFGGEAGGHILACCRA